MPIPPSLLYSSLLTPLPPSTVALLLQGVSNRYMTVAWGQ